MSLLVTLKQKQIAFLTKDNMNYDRRKKILALYEQILEKVGKGKESLPYLADYVVFLDKYHYYEATLKEADVLLRRAEAADEPYYIALAHQCLGNSSRRGVKKAEAESYLKLAQEEFSALCQNDPSEQNRARLAETLCRLATMYRQGKRGEEATGCSEEAVKRYKSLCTDFGNKYRMDHLECLWNYACGIEDYGKAIPVFESCLPAVDEILLRSSLSRKEAETVYLVCYALSFRYWKTEQHEKGCTTAEKAIRAARIMFSKNQFFCKRLSWALIIAATCYGKLGQEEKANQLWIESKKYSLLYKKLIDSHPEKDPYAKEGMKYYNNVLGNMDTDPESFTVIL